MKSLPGFVPMQLWAVAVGGLLLCSSGMTNASAQTTPPENPAAGSTPSPAQPEPKITAVTATESKLIFSYTAADAQQRTFSVQGNPLPKITVVLHDLVEAQTGAVLLSSNIKVASARDEASKVEVFNVTISGTTKPGHYVGDLELMRADKSPPDKLLRIPLDVTLRGAPAVEADVNSKSLTLKLCQSLFDFPYLGQPGPIADPAKGTSPYLREYDIYLVQSSEQPATVQSAEILGMRASAGNDLPPRVVRVSTSLPFNIDGGGTAALKIVAAGSNLAAGEYNGTLQVSIAEQKAPVRIPIKALIKDGPLLALIVLVFGLLTAFLFGWWNSKGKATQDLVKPIQQLEVDISTGKNLEVEERAQGLLLLKKTIDSLEAGDSAEEVKKRFDEAQAYVTIAQKATQDFVAEKLDPLLNRTKGIAPGRTIRERFVRTLAEIKQNIADGKYQRLDDARALVLDPLTGIDKQVTVFESTAKRLSEVPFDKRDETAIKMDDATTLAELRKALIDAGVNVEVVPGVSFAATLDALPASVAATRFELSVKRQLQLSLGAAAVALIAFLFVLAVGWISIYMKSDTFGANPMDYITLFLWGATAEAVRGQTISLTNLKTIVKEKPAGQ